MKSILVVLFLLAGWSGKTFLEVQKSQTEKRLLAGLPVGKQLQQQAIRGILGGLRPLVADLAWIRLVTAWETQQWFRVQENVWIATSTQPESILFWDVGSWHLAWNAAIDERHNLLEKSPLKRLANERFWIEQGRAVLEEGTIYHPDSYKIWLQLGWLHQERRKDDDAAFHCYEKSASLPGAPSFVARLAGYALEKQGKIGEAQDYWKKLLETVKRPSDRDLIEKRLLKLEKDSRVPPLKSVP